MMDRTSFFYDLYYNRFFYDVDQLYTLKSLKLLRIFDFKIYNLTLARVTQKLLPLGEYHSCNFNYYYFFKFLKSRTNLF